MSSSGKKQHFAKLGTNVQKWNKVCGLHHVRRSTIVVLILLSLLRLMSR